MLHWSWQPTKLQPSFTNHGMFSGTGFITKDGKPAVIYAATATDPRGSYISIAKNNNLSEWEKPYPVLPKGGPGNDDMTLRGDPDIFRVGDTYYAYSAVENVRLCKSTDLKNWTYVGGLLKHEMSDVADGEDLSCANMYRFGDGWMILCISHSMGCRYYLGDWDEKAEHFVPSFHGRMNWRSPGQSITNPVFRDFFAPESVLTPDGRRVMWAWLCTLDKNIDYKTVQSLPREISPADDGTIRIEPLRELESLRYDSVVIDDFTGSDQVATHVTDIDSDSFELRLTVDRAEANRRRFGVYLYANGQSDGLPVIIRPESGTISVGKTEAPFSVADLPEGEAVDLRVFVDKYLVEVFINGRQAALSPYMEYRNGGRGLNLYSFRGRGDTGIKIRKIEIWKLKPTNQGFFEAREKRIWAPDVE